MAPTVSVATECGLGQIVLANWTWCRVLPTDSVLYFESIADCPLSEPGGHCLSEFLHGRPVYQVKVWQLILHSIHCTGWLCSFTLTDLPTF